MIYCSRLIFIRQTSSQSYIAFFFSPGMEIRPYQLGGTLRHFVVCNGVCQGGVLSLILFTVYIDELLSRLLTLEIGCHSGYHYVGSLCYADDLALLAPSPSARRILLLECEKFAL